ncbi:integral membrane sensor signal transduction histidine kinase [Trichlorobacter lovleyi SZ]|uniref:histidine kinase n=2 Tax=Trichlorobacter lovleyi TaxID=313985 RepID=B3E3Q1_TRIL1|nr:integral membrane sensor signal transduction histidine kinase [Trichlorobacter lovleyi SZ]
MTVIRIGNTNVVNGPNGALSAIVHAPESNSTQQMVFAIDSTHHSAKLMPMLNRICFLIIIISFFGGLPLHAEQATPDNAHVIVVGGNSNYPPYQFIGKNGQPDGYIVDLTKAIAGVMGMKIDIRLGDFGGILDELENGRIDILEGLSYSESRAQHYDFSPPHSIIVHAIFARKGTKEVKTLDELRGKKVLVHRGGGMHSYMKEHNYAHDLVLTDSPRETLQQLAVGKCDYAVVALLPGMYIIREENLTNIVPIAKNIIQQRYYCYAVKKGNTELLARFNEGLTILKKTGQYDAIYNKWLGVLEPQRVSWRVIAKYAALVVIPLVLVLMGTVLWSYSLRKQVAQRTESLSKALVELRSNQQQLVQADKMAALGILVSGVAHEINNPTGIILMNMPTLRKILRDAERILDQYREEHGDYSLGGLSYERVRQELPLLLEEMQDGAERIKHTVNDLKNFARKDDEAAKVLLDFNAVVQTAVRLVDVTTRKATNSFTTSYADNLPGIMGNAQRIEQVVVNLIMNACQALPDPGRAIAISTHFDPQANVVVLTVKDEGSGIPPEHLPRLTDPFFTTKRESGGTGLGLSVSASIIKDHGGELTFDSAHGKGTTVKCTFQAAMEGKKL